jgi:hypothetical protein
MSRITLKNSTVFVAVDDETRVFRSVDEVPPEWRKRFERPKGGMKPQTILIADRKGREEIMRSLQGHPSSVQTRWKAPHSIQPARIEVPLAPAARRQSTQPWKNPRIWAEVGFVAALAGALWFTFWA